MSVPPASRRLQWTDVPQLMRSHLEGELGAPAVNVVTPAGGFGHQLVADDDSLTHANTHEAAVLTSLPPDAPAPELLGVRRAAGWTAVVIAHLDGPHPDLSPAAHDAGQTWALLDKLTSTPAPPAYVEAVSGTSSTSASLHGWAELATAPPGDLAPAARNQLPRLVDLESRWPALAHGDRICAVGVTGCSQDGGGARRSPSEPTRTFSCGGVPHEPAAVRSPCRP
ncbi:hypothetical protein ACWHAU_30580 [Streptomyces albidoflavus]